MTLLILDVEGTIFESGVQLAGSSLASTVWQAIARALGPEAEAAELETHRLWADGYYGSYLDWMRATIAIHQQHHLDETQFAQIIEGAEWADGVRDALSTIDRTQFELVLISGGFRELARRAQVDFAIRHAFAACEYFFDPSGALTGYNLLPCDFAGKLDFVRLMLREYGLGESDWVFIGDGANDANIAEQAPFSIGVHPHLELARVTTTNVESFASVPAILAGLGSPDRRNR